MHLGEGISKCVTLTSLNLYISENSFSGKSEKYLGKGISKCVALTSLKLNLDKKKIGRNGDKILR